MLLGLSYVTTDILSLRCCAMGGISLSILFQFYRPIPLYLPIRWNFLFLAINSVMVASLVNEQNEAEKMASWQSSLYESEFKEMGFTRVEFYRLLQVATKREVRKGEMVCVETKPQTKMYFVLSGEIDVLKGMHGERKKIATIPRHQFIGEMSFLTYLQEAGSLSRAEASCQVSSSKSAEVLEWDFDELTDSLQQPANRSVANALQAKLSNDLRLKLRNLNRKNSQNTKVENA